MPSADAAQRVRDRIREWVKTQGHGAKGRLAASLPAKFGEHKSRSWATSVLKEPANKGQDLRLRDLDAIADLLGVEPGDLVRRPGHNYIELTLVETKLVQYFRSLPDTVRAHWIYFLDYMFRFQQAALNEQGRERDRRTAQARRKEAQRSRLNKTGTE